MGYMCPDECILFDAKQSSICMDDGLSSMKQSMVQR
uniref:Uncharacterized protein n=1 Tax=Arundo donax TaxID=35708 RepID=A0A0A8YKF2_ARUDO